MYGNLSIAIAYRKVASSRPVYNSILELFAQKSKYIRIKFPLHKTSENPWVCYYLRQSITGDFTVYKLIQEQYFKYTIIRAIKIILNQ